MSIKINSVEITKCSRLIVSFSSPEGLNKFTEFLFRKDIKGLGFESSKKNTDYTAFFTEEETEKIKVYLKNSEDEKTA